MTQTGKIATKRVRIYFLRFGNLYDTETRLFRDKFDLPISDYVKSESQSRQGGANGKRKGFL